MLSARTCKILVFSFSLLSRAASFDLQLNTPSLIQQHDALYTSGLDHSSLIALSFQSGLQIPNSVADIYATYKQTLVTNPLETKMATGAVLAILGDGIAQAKEADTNYDTKRASSFMLFDIAYRALQHYTFPIITHECHGQYLMGAIGASPLAPLISDQTNPLLFGAMEQSLVCQLGLVPLTYYPVFYILTAVVQGLSREDGIARAKETFIPIMKRNVMFWIPVQFAVFGYVDEDFQIPLLCLSGVIWTVILSLSAGSTKKYSQEKDFIARDMLKNMDDTAVIDTTLKERKVSAKRESISVD